MNKRILIILTIFIMIFISCNEVEPSPQSWTEASVDSQTTTSADSQSAASTESQSAISADPQSAASAEAQSAISADPQSAVSAEAQSATSAEAQSAESTEPQSEPSAEPQLELSAKLQSESSTESGAELSAPTNIRLLTPTQIDDIDFAVFSEDIFCIFGRVTDNNGKQYGFMHMDGTEITPFEYDFAYPFSEGLACVRQNGKYGFINKDGSIAIPFIYDKAAPFSEGLAYFEQNHIYGFMDKSGNIEFLLNCDSVSSFQDGRAIFFSDEKYGYIDTSGNAMIRPVFDDAGFFMNGLAKVRVGDSIGFIDLNGAFVVQPIYNDVTIYGDGFLFRSDNSIGFLDGSGKEIWKIQLPPKYEYEKILSDAMIIRTDDKIRIIDFDGNDVTPFVFDFLSHKDGEEYIRVGIDGKYGHLDSSDFSVAIPFIYDYVSSFIDGYACVKLKGEYGIIDTNDNIIIPFDSNNKEVLSNGIFTVNIDKKYHLIDYKGNRINDTLFNTIQHMGNGYRVRIDSKYGFLDSNGKELIEPIYDYYTDSVYGIDNCFVVNIGKGPGNHSIIILGELVPPDLSNILLRNEITPRIAQYNQFIKENIQRYDFFKESNDFIQFTKLYYMGDRPILYYHARPILQPLSFLYSNSGFYSIKDGQLSAMVRGFESGDSAGGDYICFWRDNQTGQIYIGRYYHHGGFQGYAYGGYVFAHSKSNAVPIISFGYVNQITLNYYEDYLLENANTIYDLDGVIYNEDTILQALEEEKYVIEYFINDHPTIVEEYHKINERYSIHALWMWPGF